MSPAQTSSAAAAAAPAKPRAAKPKAAAAATAQLPADIFDAKVNVALIPPGGRRPGGGGPPGHPLHQDQRRCPRRRRKPYRQKGTGRARQGSTRAPQFAGGGVVHGPHPRSYEQRTPKKMKAAALRGALSDRARHGRVHVVAACWTATAEDRDALAALTAYRRRGAHVLVVIEQRDKATRLSLRNVRGVHLIEDGQLNTRDVLVSDHVVFTRKRWTASWPGTSRRHRPQPKPLRRRSPRRARRRPRLRRRGSSEQDR